MWTHPAFYKEYKERVADSERPPDVPPKPTPLYLHSDRWSRGALKRVNDNMVINDTLTTDIKDGEIVNERIQSESPEEDSEGTPPG